MAEANNRLNPHKPLPGNPQAGHASPDTGIGVAKRVCSVPGCALPAGHVGEHASSPIAEPEAAADARPPSSRMRVPRLELSDAPAGRCVVIRCDGRAYAYRCVPGQERELLDSVLTDARDEAHPLTFFDAALIAHRLGRQLADDLDQHEQSLRRGA